MLSLAIVGEPLRIAILRLSKIFRDLDILQISVLDVYLGGLIFYFIAILPFHLFNLAVVWSILLFSILFSTFFHLITNKKFKRPSRHDVFCYMVVLLMFGIALGTQSIVISHLIFGSVDDTSLHSLFVQLILENGHVPMTHQPYTEEGLIYPQGYHAMVAYVTYIFRCLPARAVLETTALFSAMSVLGAYYLGKRLSKNSKWTLAVSLSFVFTFIAIWPTYITWGSNAFVASIPFYFICLSLLPPLLKSEKEFNKLDLAVIGILFGYLVAVHLQPYQCLVSSMMLYWLVKCTRDKRKALCNLTRALFVIFLSIIPPSPFYYRGIMWYSYPHHNIGVAEDVISPNPPYALSNFQNVFDALFVGVRWFLYYLAPSDMLRMTLILLIFCSVMALLLIRKNVTNNDDLTKIISTTFMGELLIVMLGSIFPSLPFYPNGFLLYISLYFLIGLLIVWLHSTIPSLFRSNVAKINFHKNNKNNKMLATILSALMIALVCSPFIYHSFLQRPSQLIGGYRVFAVTSSDDVQLMLWMKDNLPRNATILVNRHEAGLFIPSISHHKIIFPRTASANSRSYQELCSLIEDRNLNATVCELMEKFNITHVYVGSHVTAVDKWRHKWNPAIFLQNPNFKLVKQVGNAWLFAFEYKYPNVAFLEDFEYDNLDETGWQFHIARECAGTGSGNANISLGHAFSGNRSLMITSMRDKEWFYACWVYRKVCIWDSRNVTLSFYLDATEGFSNWLDHFMIIIADCSWKRAVVISTPYALINPEQVQLEGNKGFFKLNISELWREKYNSPLPKEFYIELQNFDADGVENVAYIDHITIAVRNI